MFDRIGLHAEQQHDRQGQRDPGNPCEMTVPQLVAVMAIAPNMKGTIGSRYLVLVDDRASARPLEKQHQGAPTMAPTALRARRTGSRPPRRNNPKATTTVPQSTMASSTVIATSP